MSKTHRGKGIRDQFAHGRGECPVCKRKSVKILYEMEAGEQKFKICKICKAAIKNGKKSLPVTVTAKASEVAEVTALAAEPAVSPEAAQTEEAAE
jgi:hypothetical protein